MSDNLKLRDTFSITEAATVEGDVLRNVVLHGPVSNNGNEYSAQAMRSLVPLLEGRAVYVNHRVGKKMRDVDERFGHVEAVRFVESDHDGRPRVRGDLHFMRSHRDSAQIVESYTKGLPYYGTSIVADGKGHSEGGKRYVEQVTRLSSLDLVDRAATGSLVEQDADPAAAHAEALKEMCGAIIDSIMSGGLTLDEGLKKIKAHLEAAQDAGPPPGEPPPADAPPMPPMNEATLNRVVGTLVEQAVTKALTSALPALVEQETRRRADAAQYVKPHVPSPPPVVTTAARKDAPPTDPAKRKAWLHS